MPQATLKFSATVTWAGVPVQRCTVHKERNLLAHAPTALHEEIKAGCSDMMYAKTAGVAIAKRKAFLKKWRLRCRGVANSLEEAGSDGRRPIQADAIFFGALSMFLQAACRCFFVDLSILTAASRHAEF